MANYLEWSNNSDAMNKQTPIIMLARAVTLGLLITMLSGCASIVASMSEPGHIDEPKSTRTFGTYVEDQNIEVKVKANLLNADAGYENAHFSVISYNRIVLLVGQVPDQSLLERATRIAEKVRLVRKVHNEMTVAEPTALAVRVKDSWITTKIKAHMLATKYYPASRTVVITENGVVYLMGLLSQSEANWAVDIVRQIYGVEKIVKIIEYTD